MKQTKTRKITKRRIIIGIVTVIALYFYGVGSGYLPYVMAYAKCGKQPIAATRFAASYTYELPSEAGYSISPFNEYYCSQAEAEAHGFHPSPGTVEARKQEEELNKKQAEEKRLDMAKLDYTAYKPTLENFPYSNLHLNNFNGQPEVFYDIKNEGTIVAQVREGKVGNEYELCQNPERRCEVVGTDSKGREVKREYSKTSNDTLALTARIGDTYVNITKFHDDFTLTEAISIFGSMEKME